MASPIWLGGAWTKYQVVYNDPVIASVGPLSNTYFLIVSMLALEHKMCYTVK